MPIPPDSQAFKVGATRVRAFSVNSIEFQLIFNQIIKQTDEAANCYGTSTRSFGIFAIAGIEPLADIYSKFQVYKVQQQQLVNQFLKCLGLTKSRAVASKMSTILVVLGENWRKKDLSCDHHNSIGLKSGEQGDKFSKLAPAACINGSIVPNL